MAPGEAAMANSPSSIAEQIRQLNDARKLVLSDVNFYTNIVQGILPIIGPSSLPPLRRWGADFLAETFSTPALPSRDKETLSLLVLESLKGMVEKADEDSHVLRSVIQTAASIYPLVMRWMYAVPLPPSSAALPPLTGPTQNQQLVRHAHLGAHAGYQVKNTAHLGRSAPGYRHLLHKVCPARCPCPNRGGRPRAEGELTSRLHIPSHGRICADQRLQHQRDGLEVSLALVPPGHPLLDPRNLEAEATGLLDRMLGSLQDSNRCVLSYTPLLQQRNTLALTRGATNARCPWLCSNALTVDATLNTLSVLIRTRPGTSNRILNAVLSFNPLKLGSSSMTPKTRVLVKSMEKTTRMLLRHLLKR